MTDKRKAQLARELKIIKVLIKLVIINPETGTVTWIKTGKQAGGLHKSTGYFRINYWNAKAFGKPKQIFYHRLIFYYVHNYLPDILDHKNQIKTDNRIENLRETTRQGNARNCSTRKTNKSGTTGVSWCKTINKWRAYIRISYSHISLGSFDKKEDAIQTRQKAEILYFGEFRSVINKTPNGERK